MSDDLISTGEAARILGVSTDTVRRWAKEGKLTVVGTIDTKGTRLLRRKDV